MQHPFILSNNNTNYSWGQKFKKGHYRSSHAHERWYGQEQKRKVVTYYIPECSAFLCYASCTYSKTLSFEVIRGQLRSAWGQLFDLKLAKTYFLCNAAVFSFPLICNMPIFNWIWNFQFLRSVNGGQKLWSIAPRSNEVMDIK